MKHPEERIISVRGGDVRVWEKGSGEPLGFLPGLGGLPRWRPFLDRLAERRRVVAPSLPGFPGGGPHDRLDETVDWIVATLDVLEGAGLAAADWVGVSVGATLALDAAAMTGDSQGRLALVAPLGIYAEGELTADMWACRPRELPALLCRNPDAYASLVSDPGEADAFEWQLEQTRAYEAAARLLWPLCDTRVAARLHRVRRRTLLVWGSDDRLVPASHAKRFQDGITGPVTVRQLGGAGHLADIDAPDALAEMVLDFLAA